jgi:hypothetical protein
MDIHPTYADEAPPGKWSMIDVSFLADFPKTEREIDHEEEAIFGRADCSGFEAGGSGIACS